MGDVFVQNVYAKGIGGFLEIYPQYVGGRHGPIVLPTMHGQP